MDAIRASLQNYQDYFFQFSNGAGNASPLSTSCALVSVTEYATGSLNIPKYP